SEDILPDKWVDITYNDFRDYRINHNWSMMNKRANIGVPGVSSSAGSGTTSGTLATGRKSQSEVFRSTIKKDYGSYPILKQDNDFEEWYRQVKAQSNIHDVTDVFDESYVPAGLEETELFQIKQQFVYAVLLRTLLTNKGKSLVRENEGNHDAQKIIKELIAHHRKSTKSELESTDRLAY
ncbi:MAG: hypothetical protein CUN57_01185, partial [Phototrophicales bacterium]